MPRVVLVAGLVPYDSGKTWFTVATGLATREKGFRVGVFKPVAGHNLWYSPRTCQKTLKLKLLVGNDILMYYRYGLAENPAISNPVAIATLPPDPTRYTKLDNYFEEFDDVRNVAVLTRVYSCETGVLEHYVHVENLNKTSTTCQVLVSKLCIALNAKPKPFTEVASYLMSPRVEEDLNHCLKYIGRGRDVVFVEGFNDAVVAYTSLLEEADLLVVVTPGKVLVYENMKAIKYAVEKAVNKHGYEGLRTRYIVESVNSNYTFETGFALKPTPRKVHRDFVEKVVMRLLSD